MAAKYRDIAKVVSVVGSIPIMNKNVFFSFFVDYLRFCPFWD